MLIIDDLVKLSDEFGAKDVHYTHVLPLTVSKPFCLLFSVLLPFPVL